MAEETYRLEYDGYWRDVSKAGIPDQSGVYSVYACAYNPTTQNVTINKLLYIGEAANVRGRISNHEKWNDWRRHLKYGEVLCFSFSPISPEGARLRAEAALIHEHKPPENVEYVNAFPFERTTVFIGGASAKLKAAFTVNKTVSRDSLFGNY